MRIAFLLAGLTGYNTAQLRALHARGHELFVTAPVLHGGDQTDTSFGDLGLTTVATVEPWTSDPDPDALVTRLADFAPDAVVMVSWNLTTAYRAVMKAVPTRCVRILMMDNLWRATPRQWLGRATHQFYIDPLFDAVLVPSERTEFYARRLGFGGADIIRGSLCADLDVFIGAERTGAELVANRRFLYVGRLAWHKGADVLATAYSRYRCTAADPWELHVAGIGELEYLFADRPGVVSHGFRQPDEVAALMRQASALVVPSHVEPYGVVVHEATAMGLPVLCTDFAGAGPGLVQDGYNGWTVPGGDTDAWVEALERVSTLPPDRLGSMSQISRALSRRSSPQQWAENLEGEVERRRAHGGGRLSLSRRLHPRAR